MTTTVRLLGRPEITRDGTVVPMRGNKSWAVLAVLLLTRGPISRQRLAALLFDQADDPLRTLRWNLAQIRRSLGADAMVEGDPIELRLAPGTIVDLDVLERGMWSDIVELPGLGDELLAGVSLSGSDAFDAWLAAERARIATLAAGHLSDATLSQLAAGQFSSATALAARLVELQPFDEVHHELLVRALAASGQIRAARDHVALATELLVREIGIAPGPSLAACVEVDVGTFGPAPNRGRASALAQLDAGEAAVSAGATDAGLDCLRRAVQEARSLRDAELEIRALTSLGSALIHGVRGRDTEGAATLHQAIRIAQAGGLDDHTASAHRELAWVAVQQGRHHQAMSWLVRAAALARDEGEQARILGVRGLTFDDSGRHGLALADFHESALLATAADDRRQLAWTRSMQARAHLQMGEHEQAAPFVDESLELTLQEGWTAFRPYPQIQRADLQLWAGDVDPAIENLEHAFALACHLGDPCWEGLAGRGLANADAESGQIDAAISRLRDARQRCARHPDTYRWVIAQVVATMCEIGVDHHLSTTDAWINELETIAAASGLRDLVVRAHLHRADLGHPGALDAAIVLAGDLDNPLLVAATTNSPD